MMSQLPNEESVDDYVLQTMVNSDEHCGSPAKTDEDEDEDEDIDFNPFLKETPSPEASSSLSSEIEEAELDVVETEVEYFHKGTDGVQSSTIQDPLHSEEETRVPRAHPPKEIYEMDLQEPTSNRLADKELEISENENQDFCQTNDPVSVEINRGMMANDAKHSQKPAVLLDDDNDDDDAICKRTRARYSLASFTLDELESFLQETDDDDDLPNVDDEEEYRKFLAAVLQGRDVDGQLVLESGNFDDEDEDNDADFEIELEEALESDVDERPTGMSQKESCKQSGRRPETRQNRRQRSSTEYKRKLLEQSKRPLRPLLPMLPIGVNANSSINSGVSPITDAQSNSLSLPAGVGSVNGFTPFQIGQLYCLIHEHVQLLIQIYSLCVLDPPRQRIVSQLQELLFEILEKRDQVVACRTAPYPAVCFWPPYLLPSVLDGSPRSFQGQHAVDCAPAYGAQVISSAQDNQIPTNVLTSSSNKQQEHACDGVMDSYQAVGGSLWLPIINGPVLSILDVAPLNLVKNFMDDMDLAVQEHRRRHFESASEARPEREPLFPFASFQSAADGDTGVLKEVASANAVKGSSTSNQQPQKRSLAAALVESTKKQSVALVPKEVAKSAQMFCPLFNQALFPRKPPPVSVASRVLFTDAEDELLALGMMEYNTDWKAIQQRFLPCKAKHQIFVRQKNRCSSKAPDNPIKAVRKMKTSALTEEELKRIQEGLKIYKLDWMSVWKFIVPHRDPSLLPRQYRVALGTQKSYKQDPVRKEKRRIYEAERRKRKDGNLASWQHDPKKDKAKNTGRESSSGDGCIDDPEEAYVHEAFLADWMPSTCSQISSRQPALNIAGGGCGGIMFNQQNTQNGKKGSIDDSMETQSHLGNMHLSSSEPDSFQHPYAASLTYNGHGMSSILAPGHSVSSTLACPPHHSSMNFTPGSHFCWSRQGRQNSSTHLVKLAPNLPPVNLPRNVRVISQSAYRNHLDVHTTQAVVRDAIPQHPNTKTIGSLHPTERSQGKTFPDGSDIGVTTNEPLIVKENHITEGSQGVSDLQMHPLLFQAPEDGCQLYNPSSCRDSPSNSFSFFSGNQPQLNLTLFHNHNPPKPVPSIEKSSKLPGVDFHPLLQRMDDANTDCLATCSSDDPSAGLGSTSAQACNNDHTIPSQNDGNNELDLEIHLSSASRDGFNLEILDQNANERRPVACRASIENASKVDKTSALYGQQNGGASYINRELFSKSQNSFSPNDGIAQCSMDAINDQSQAEIVMEQEELSDSDEDIEENVEFECEEMTDSEGEDESGTEACTKEASNLGMKDVNINTDQNHQQYEASIHYCTRTDDTIPCNNSPSLKSVLACNQQDTSKSWLSLDSCACTGVTSRKLKPVTSTIVEGSVRNSVSSHSEKTAKKLRPHAKSTTVQQRNQAVEIVKQDAGSLPAAAAGRPRKRPCKRNSNADKGGCIS